MGKVVGIDLGTTNSLVAYATERGPVVIRDASGDALVPSVVSVDAAGTVFVGREAQRRLLTDSARTVYSVKRFMGRGVDDVQGEAHLLPFRVGGEAGGVVRIGVGDKEFTPPEISGGANSLSPTPMRTTPPASPPTRNGSRCASSCTSSTPRPMKRFTEYTVRDGSVRSRRCASRPTNTVPAASTDTIDGRSASPDESRITSGTPSRT